MTKKHFGLIAAALILVLSMTVLVACNSYKWDAIGGGNPSAETISNGGYFVRQGGYAYFVNGYVGDSADNTWGTPLKQSIMRAELNADGSVNNDTAKVLVPKSVYNKDMKGGIAVFGEWIYYATPNNEPDKSGTASTTHTDFMRTKIDGSLTQLIGTINSREAQYLFTPTRVLYYLNSTISYIDFSGMKTNKEIKDGSGASHGTIASNVTSVLWNYDAAFTSGQGKAASDYIFYTQSVTGDDSYKHYNNLYAVRYDGSDSQLLISETSYLSDGENAVDNPLKVFTIALLGSKVESDSAVTIYYTKSHYVGSAVSVGLYCNKFTLGEGLGALTGEGKTEKQLSTQTPTVIFPISYAEGCLAQASAGYYWYNGETSLDESRQVTASSVTGWYVYGDYFYYTASSSATALYRINYKQISNAETVLKETIIINYLNLEFDGTTFYFFASDDYSYLHYIDILTFDSSDKDAKSVFIGKMTDADAKAKADAEKEDE